MLIDTLLGLLYRCIGITAVILPGRILTIAQIVIFIAHLAGRGRQMWIWCIIVDSPIAAMRQRIIAVGGLLFHILIEWRLHQSLLIANGGRRHFHLPQRVLRVDAAAIVRIRIIILHVAHVDPCKHKRKKRTKLLNCRQRTQLKSNKCRINQLGKSIILSTDRFLAPL